MKARILSIFTAILAVIAMLSALDLSGIISLIPGGNDAMVALVTGSLATLGTILRAIGDLMDDGLVNNSFGKLRLDPFVFLCACGLALTALILTSCQSGGISLPTGVVVSGTYEDPSTGAKAVISSSGSSKLIGTVRVPIKNSDGSQTGWVDISSSK